MTLKGRIRRAAACTGGLAVVLSGLLVEAVAPEAAPGAVIAGSLGSGAAVAGGVLAAGAAFGLRVSWAAGAWLSAVLVLLFPLGAAAGWVDGILPPGAPGGWPALDHACGVNPASAALAYGGPLLGGTLAFAALRLSRRPH